MPATLPTKITSQYAWAPVEAWTSAAAAATKYAAQAVSRRSSPLDIAEDFAEFARVVTLREKPTWAHDSREVRVWPLARLLDYSTAAPTAAVPTLVLPPQAGHASSVVDYGRTQSQMMTLRDGGLDNLYAMDWCPATAETADCSIEDYLTVLEEVVESLGGRVNLVGDCQGGWLAVIYAGLHPDHVNTITIGGAPIDTHAGESGIQEWTRLLARRNELTFYEALVRLGGGVQRGKSQLRGFKLLEPGAEIGRVMDLMANIHDPDYVTRHIDFTNWFEWTQDVPGAFYLWIIEHLFVHNELARGELVIGGARVDLSVIDCPLFLLAGTKDHITPAEQVWALADLVSTPAEHVSRELVDAGHLGLFMGRAALADHWRPIAQRVRSHSERVD
ncbi:alpha/beta fold hydrolase [Mycolicibacterium sp.]|uniref:alpha/beta fold hydrolase n=1 Tax=Mycolicibacterium sp. TaxID=2320850 RepID=UPI0037C5060D